MGNWFFVLSIRKSHRLVECYSMLYFLCFKLIVFKFYYLFDFGHKFCVSCFLCFCFHLVFHVDICLCVSICPSVRPSSRLLKTSPKTKERIISLNTHQVLWWKSIWLIEISESDALRITTSMVISDRILTINKKKILSLGSWTCFFSLLFIIFGRHFNID